MDQKGKDQDIDRLIGEALNHSELPRHVFVIVADAVRQAYDAGYDRGYLAGADKAAEDLAVRQ